MTPDLSQILQVVQLVTLLGGFGGLTFSVGRVFGRIESLEKSQNEMKAMLSGGDDGDGIFLRRAEARIMLESATQQHEAFDRRLEELGVRLGALEVKKAR